MIKISGEIPSKEEKVLENPVMQEDRGFGASLGISEADIQTASIREKGDAQVAFERLGNVTKNTVENIWNKGVEIFGRCKAWAAEKWDTIKTVTKEWTGDVIETVRLNTVDKWRALNEADEYNLLIQKKEADIRDLEGRFASETHNIAVYETSQKEDEEKFQSALASIKDPTIWRVFDKNRGQKAEEWSTKIKKSEISIKATQILTEQYQSEITNFKNGIEKAGNNFAERLDSKIEQIENKNGYAEKKEYINNIDSIIGEHADTINSIEHATKEHLEYLELAKGVGLGEEDIANFENKIKELWNEREKTQNAIDVLTQEKQKIQEEINQIDKKTARYKKMKQDMGLDKKSTESEGVVQTEEVGQVPQEENVSVDANLDLNLENENADEGVENIEDNVEGREEIESSASKVFELISSKNVKAVEIVDELIKLRNTLNEYTENNDADDTTESIENLNEILDQYDRQGIEVATEAVTEQLKKTTLNKVIRRLPVWIEIGS